MFAASTLQCSEMTSKTSLPCKPAPEEEPLGLAKWSTPPMIGLPDPRRTLLAVCEVRDAASNTVVDRAARR